MNQDASQLLKLVKLWNSTESEYPRQRCIHQFFDNQVELHPQALAVIEAWGEPENRSLTYLELNRRANQLAHYLRKRGVGPEKIVAVCLERSVDLVVAIFGVLKAGGAYLPLDPDYPAQRLEFMLSDAHASLLLTQERLLPGLGQTSSEAIPLDLYAEALSMESADNPVNLSLPDNLAYAIYTSGSTGRPKGALNTHGALSNHFSYQQMNFPVSVTDRVLLKSPTSFDAFGWELFTALQGGAALVVAAPGRNWEAGYLLRTINEYGVTMFMLVPSFLRVMLEDPRFENCSRLRWLIAGGEALPSELVAQVKARVEVDIANFYGPAEACIDTVVYRVPRSSTPGIIPIGRPIANTRAYILDEHLELAPIGQAGELCLAGDNLGRGYLGRPELTAECFIPDPFDGNGGRLYRTGDLVRCSPEGEIEYLGRVDFQVKIRGSRLELGEIEKWLHSHPAIRQAAVVVRETPELSGNPGEKRLVAYIALRGDARLSTRELQGYLSEHLPGYMVPATFTFLDGLPHSTSGKVDRLALAGLQPAQPVNEAEYLAPKSELEKVLAGIWSQVLMVDRVGVHDNFYDLGGNSLALAQVQARVYDRYRIDLPILDASKVPDVAWMAEQIERKMLSGDHSRLPPIEHVRRDRLLPLSYPQEQVWFLLSMEPNSLAYNFQISVRLRGSLDREALRRTMSEIVVRHEIYRTTFEVREGRPVQIIHDPWQAFIPLADLSHLQADDRQAQAEKLIEGDFTEVFDIRRLPLIRWKLLKFSEDEHLLIHMEHHLVHDGWSFAILMQELQALYSAFSSGMPSPLPDLEFQFADYAAWQRQVMEGEYKNLQLAYWRERLKNAPQQAALPGDHPRPAHKSYRGASIQRIFDGSFYSKIKAFSLREGYTLFTTFLAPFNALLFLYSGQEDLLVGSGFANRRMRETEPLIGMFVNSVVLRSRLSGEIDFHELLKQTSQTISEAAMHQDLPFEKLVEELQPPRDLGYNPYFQVVFSFHDSAIPELEFPDLKGKLEHRQNKSAKFDLNVVIIPRAEQLHRLHSRQVDQEVVIVWEYDTDLFERDSMERMLDHYLNLLLRWIEKPDQKLSRIDFLGERERIQILEDWSGVQQDYPRDRTIPELFSVQVERTPQAIGVYLPDEGMSSDENRSVRRAGWTYEMLDRRSNQLARMLQSRSLKPGQVAGVFLERGIDSICSFLAILKAGAAYLPLDTSYPTERLKLMIEDSGSSVILTEEKFLSRLPASQAQVICLDRDRKRIMLHEETSLPVLNSPLDLAYVIYTSGSTGRPKGTGIPQRAIIRLVCGSDYVQVRQGDCIAQASNMSFDAATFEIWGTLLNGGSLDIVPQEVVLNPKAFAAWLGERSVQSMFLTAALFNQIAMVEPAAFSRVRDMMVGGEALTPSWVGAVLEADPPDRLLNVYGPTENTTFTTWYPITKVENERRSIPIGKPIANTRVYVLDRWLNPVPAGVPGELYIGGDGLGWGYLRRPELTAEKFIPDPFGEAGGRLYRSGDLVRWLRDGDIEFLGRIDTQIKLRGFRVELGEIETALQDHPAVKQAVVLLREDRPGDKRLVAYVVLHDNDPVEIQTLRDYLGKRLPGYMVPQMFLFIPELPVTPNGKVDRRALPEPSRLRIEPDNSKTSPMSSFEQVMLQVWSDLLGFQVNRLEANFFELGGHSLLAIRLMYRMLELFELQLNPRLIFESPSAGGFIRAIQREAADADRLEKTAQVWIELEKLSDEGASEILSRMKDSGEV